MHKKINFLLSDTTALGIGGPAKEFIEVKTEDELISIIKGSMQKYLVIGGGSNLLVSDQGYDGLIIKNNIKGIKRDGNRIIAKSGVVLQDLVNFATKEGLSGLQELTGIPGTLGGAVYGNAGAYGQTISDYIVSVKVLNNNLTIEKLNNSACQFSYRDSNFKKNGFIILEVEFELLPGYSVDLQRKADETLNKRLTKYPPGIKCPGSFFKNIPVNNLPQEILEKVPKEAILFGKVSAGALMESVGAKDAKLGNIKIASYHANLFINEGSGTALDFYNLAKKYFEKVKEKFGIELEPEVQLVNLPPF